MRKKQPKTLSEKIDFGVHLGVARALAMHKKNGTPIAIWRDGKVVIVPPEEIEIPEEFRDILGE